MKTPLLIPALFFALATMGANAGVAPESLKGKQVNFIFEGAAVTDAAGNILHLPTWRSRSVVFDADTTATGSRSGTMYYDVLLPATARIQDDGFSGTGYRLNGAEGCRGEWTLYFADATHGSAVFMGQEKGKEIQFRNVCFTITEPQAGEPEMPKTRECILVPSAEKADGAPVSLAGKEVVFAPGAEQAAELGGIPLDMAFGHCYRGHASEALYNPLAAVLIPGDKALSWGTWRSCASGMTERICQPCGHGITYHRNADGTGYVGCPASGFSMTFTSPTAGTATLTIGGKKVENIPFSVKPCVRPDEIGRFEPAGYHGLPFGDFGEAKGVRVAWIDSTFAATMRPVQDGKVELCVFYDPAGDGKWKEHSRQTVKLPGSMEDVAPLIFENEGAMHFYDLELGEVVGESFDLPK